MKKRMKHVSELPQKAFTILRRKQVESRTGLSRSTIYARIAAGLFPSPIDLGGGRAVGWIEAEIDAWVQVCIKESRKDR
jgi:prophage regulatory protein